MSLLQKLFDADFWKQRVKALSRDLNTTYDNLCEVTEKWRSAEEDVRDLKAEVQIAEDDFDEMANLYTNLHKAFDDLVDTNADLAKKLREATLYKTTNEKLQRDIVDLQQYNAAVTTEVKKLQVASAEWDSMYKGYVTATNENSRLKAENESLAKNLVEVTKTPAEFTKHCNQLKTELQTANNEIIALKEQLQSFNTERGFRATEYKILSEQYDKLHKANEALTAEIARLEQSKYPIYEKLVADKANSDQALAKLMLEKNQLDREHRALKLKYDALQSELLIKNRRLIDKVKVVEEIVKELMPVSMRFQTALFDLIEVPNVSGT